MSESRPIPEASTGCGSKRSFVTITHTLAHFSQAHIAFQHDLDKSLRESGELVSAEGLASPHEAKIVRAGKDGAPITDGVFPEAERAAR